jgi:hypothetical protein
MQLRRFLPLAAALLSLAACVPATPGNATATVTADQVSYYPSQSGLIWAYLKPGEPLNTAPYIVRIEGPSSYNAKVLTGMRFIGRGTERFYYREFDPTGVKLWGEGATDFYQFVYDQPVQEYPAENTLAIGKTWSGESTGKLVTKESTKRVKYTYIFRVVSKEKFKIRDTEYDAFLILRDNRLEYLDLTAAEAAKPEFRPVVESQRVRFVPFIGEVETREGLVLVDYNFKPRAK